MDHGANPGLVSHFTKRALLEIASAMIERNQPAATGVDRASFEKLVADAESEGQGAFARLSQATGTKVIHISERDTQVSSQPKAINEFVNTWSIEGFYEEGTAPAELGWGTHERRLPKHAHTPIGGPGNQIFLAQPGVRTLVHSWVPAGGPIIGMVVRHAESFTISDYLTVWEDTIEGRRAVYRPTVHYAYMPCDNGILSLYELTMRNFQLQPTLRIMSDEITGGMDELGVLLMGHGLNAWWTGSQLDIHETRKLVPGQNATTLQVAAAVLGGLVFMIRHPPRASSSRTSCRSGRSWTSRVLIWVPVRRFRRTGRPWPAARVCSRNGALRRWPKKISGNSPVSPSNRDETVSLLDAHNRSTNTRRWRALQPSGSRRWSACSQLCNLRRTGDPFDAAPAET